VIHRSLWPVPVIDFQPETKGLEVFLDTFERLRGLPGENAPGSPVPVDGRADEIVFGVIAQFDVDTGNDLIHVDKTVRKPGLLCDGEGNEERNEQAEEKEKS